MQEPDIEANVHSRQVASIRAEMNFEVGVLHDRINALISFEAFLLISFTMSLSYAGGSWTGKFFWVAPALSLIGLILPVLAWPGVNTSFRIITEWNLLLIEAIGEAQNEPGFIWRPSVQIAGGVKTQAHHRSGMLFSRFVPVTFIVAWGVLIVIVITAPLR